MKSIDFLFKTFWLSLGNGSGMDREWIGNESVNGSSHALGMSTSGEAYIEHIMSIYSAYIGTSRHAGGKKYGTMKNSCVWKYAACLFIGLVLCVGNVWGTAPSLSDLNFSSLSVVLEEDFNDESTGSKNSIVNPAGDLEDYGIFNKIYNNNTLNTYAIEDETFSSNSLKLSQGSGSALVLGVSGKTYGSTGSFRFKTTTSSKCYVGICTNAPNSNAYTKADASVFIKSSEGVIGISKNTTNGNWQNVGTYTSTTEIDICVIYNNTNSGTTYGNSITLGSKTAHVYVNGSCATSDGTTPINFTISGLELSYFKVSATQYDGDIAYIDDIIVYSGLPSAACSNAVTLASPSITGSGTITFSPSGSLASCSGGASTTMTITPSSGYYLSSFSNTTGDGYVSPNNSPSIATSGNTSEAAQEIDLEFDEDANDTYEAVAIFSPILVSSLSLSATQTGESDKTGNDLTMTLYRREGQGNDPLTHSLTISGSTILPSNAQDKTYTWSVRVKEDGDENWTDVDFTTNTLNTNTIIEFNKNTGVLKAKDKEGTAEIKISANDGSGVSAKVTITVVYVSLTDVSVAPTSMTLFAGERKSVAVSFTPANATDRSFSAGSSYTYVNIQNKAAASFSIEGKSSVTDANHEETVTVTTTEGSYTATIDVTIKPLPIVHFKDLIHNTASAEVSATTADGVVSLTKNSPTSADWTGAHCNDCEEDHTHLIGWIDSEWTPVANYMNGTGEAPDDEDFAGIEEANVFLEPGAEINTETLNGKTYYAVWSTIE